MREIFATWVSIARKEFIHLSRNSFMLRMVATLQVTQLILLGFIDTTAHDLPLAIVDQDQSASSRQLMQKVRATNVFDVRFLTSSIAQAREHVRAGRAKAALVIPPDFHEARARHGAARVLAMVDGSDSVASAQALGAIEGMTAEMENLELEIDPPTATSDRVNAHTMLLFNPTGRTSNFTLPALVAMIMANAYIILTAMAFARERGMGTLERLTMAPLNPLGFALGKLTPYYVAALFNAATLVLVMRWAFRVPIAGSAFLLAGCLAVYIVSSVAMGLLVGGNAMPPEVHARMIRLQIPMFFLSGYLFPITSLPSWLVPVAYALPVTHMIEVMRGIVLRGAGIGDLWGHLLYLVFIGPALLVLGARRFAQAMES